MSTTAALVAVCVALVALAVVIGLTLVHPHGRRLKALLQIPTTRIPSGGMMQIYPIRKGAPMNTVQYTVPGMHCGHCEAAVKEEVSTVPGVESVVVDLETKRVEVTGPALDDGAIRAAIEEAGYEAA